MTRPRPEQESVPEPGLEERDPEAPAPDAAEQAASANPADPATRPVAGAGRGLEVGEWDAVEQSVVVELEDDYDH